MLFLILCISFALFPNEVLMGAQSGLALCMNAVIPSLLPFMLISSCLIRSNFSRPLGYIISKILSPFTKISPSGCVCFLTGLTGGYGAGAKAVKESYEKKLIDKSEAESLLAFCNNPGPLFIIGTVGIHFLADKEEGMFLFFASVISAFVCSLFFMTKEKREKTDFAEEWNFYKKNKPSFSRLITECAISSGSAVITCCVFIITFCALIEILPASDNVFIQGFLEVTRGCSEASRKGSSALPLISALLAWGGMSVHLQTNALCKGELSLKKYYAGKIISAVLCYLMTYLFKGNFYALALFIIFLVCSLVFINIVRVIFSSKLPRQPLFRQQKHS